LEALFGKVIDGLDEKLDVMVKGRPKQIAIIYQMLTTGPPGATYFFILGFSYTSNLMPGSVAE